MDLLLKAKRAYQHRQENKKIDKSGFKTRHTFEKSLFLVFIFDRFNDFCSARAPGISRPFNTFKFGESFTFELTC